MASKQDWAKLGVAVLVGGVAGWAIAKKWGASAPATGLYGGSASFGMTLPSSGGKGLAMVGTSTDRNEWGLAPDMAPAPASAFIPTYCQQMMRSANPDGLSRAFNNVFSTVARSFGESNPNVTAIRNAAISVYGNRDAASSAVMAAVLQLENQTGGRMRLVDALCNAVSSNTLAPAQTNSTSDGWLRPDVDVKASSQKSPIVATLPVQYRKR